jgi:hypothetical protein
MDIISAVVTLFLVMDPLGNIPRSIAMERLMGMLLVAEAAMNQRKISCRCGVFLDAPVPQSEKKALILQRD